MQISNFLTDTNKYVQARDWKWVCAWTFIPIPCTKPVIGKIPRTRNRYKGRTDNEIYDAGAWNASLGTSRNEEAGSRPLISLDCNASVGICLATIACNAMGSLEKEVFQRSTVLLRTSIGRKLVSNLSRRRSTMPLSPPISKARKSEGQGVKKCSEESERHTGDVSDTCSELEGFETGKEEYWRSKQLFYIMYVSDVDGVRYLHDSCVLLQVWSRWISWYTVSRMKLPEKILIPEKRQDKDHWKSSNHRGMIPKRVAELIYWPPSLRSEFSGKETKLTTTWCNFWHDMIFIRNIYGDSG